MTAYYEVEGWPKIWHTDDGVRAQRKLECAWTDRLTVATEVDAYPARIFPYGSSGIQVSQVGIIPAPKSKMDGTNDIATYDTAHLIVDYSSHAASTAALISERLTTATSAISYSHTGLEWSDGVALIKGEEPIGIRGSMTYTLRYHKAGYIPNSVSYTRYINNNNFQTKILGIVFYPGALVYRGANVLRTLQINGVKAFDIVHTMGYSPHGWNKTWRNETSTWEVPYDKATGNPMLAHPNTAFNF